MKSLSDYTKILRDTATNLNLHGESVEMVVQMLANALYISEVEHIAYSQEASLERATQENSKIQHCVDQMYSVFRGSNPRVVINFKASKLFTFKLHQEIIRSNNYTVYYLGYFDESTKTILYSDLQVTPDSTETIIGILSKEVVTRGWTTGVSENPYYYTLPVSNLSNDLYLDIGENQTRTSVTRIFSDHLREDIPFDLTIPGYGLRLYYPEYLQGEKGFNTKYSLSVYKYMSLSEIQESERKAIKMIGAQILSFEDPSNDRSWILKELKAIETYPGVIFIPETSKDAIDTIHHKANKARYSGSYLATNSDLSWILQEYYPSKIRRQGVTYRFESPESTYIETVSESKKVKITKGDIPFLTNSFKNGSDYLPEGELKFKYKSSGNSFNSNSSYEILPSVSVIPVRASYTSLNVLNSKNYLLPTVSDITFRVLKNTDGVLEILTTKAELDAKGLKIECYIPNSNKTISNLSISKTDISVSSTSDKPLEITLSTKSGTILDKETIPFTYIPVTIGKVDLGEDQSYMTVTEEGPGDYYTFDLQEDTLYIKTDPVSGKVLVPATTVATLYHNGKEINGANYSLIPSSDTDASIDSNSGVITISEISENKKEVYLIVKARYNGINFQSLLVCRKTISNLNSTSGPSFSVYSNLSSEYPILTLPGYEEEKEAIINIPEGKYKNLKIKTKGDITFGEGEYIYTYKVPRNLIPEGEQTIPKLHLYYIPYSESNTLDEKEISKFIESNKSYYITQDIEISPGTPIIAKFDVSLDLYKNTSLDGSVLEILQRYSYLFNQDFGGMMEDEFVVTKAYSEIKSLITKISEVRGVTDIKVSYLNSRTREEVSYEKIKSEKTPVYFIVECVIYSTIME